MRERVTQWARIVWFVLVWKLRLWRIRPMRVYNSGLQVWLQRPEPTCDDVLPAQVVAALDELDDSEPLVTVLSAQQRLTVAVLASRLVESVGALGSAMTLEHARLMVDQIVQQARAVREYVGKIS